MKLDDPKPLVGIPADTWEENGLLFHSAGDKYFRALAQAAKVVPVMFPSLGSDLDADALLDRLDGVLMTGATSNVHPPRYQTDVSVRHEPYDELRDETTLPLIAKAIERGMPLFCICRGFQELNVALGGTLDTELQEIPGRLDHRAPKGVDLDIRYGPAHEIAITKGGLLDEVLGAPAARVNTVHRQGIAQVSSKLAVEAVAPDGTIEAVSVKGAPGFSLAVQWHPEYKAIGNPDSVKLFEAFGLAARRYARARRALRAAE
jgi:putative glutamine amidotransferase